MQPELGNGHSQTGTHDAPANSMVATLSHIEHDVNDLIAALALLGVKRCSRCRQFFRCADPGALFDSGEPVCYDCIPDWWTLRSTQIGVADREQIEGKLASWLRKHHRGEVVKETPGKVFDAANAAFEIVAKCVECAGSGKLMEGERCRFCNGLGTVRVVVPK